MTPPAAHLCALAAVAALGACGPSSPSPVAVAPPPDSAAADTTAVDTAEARPAVGFSDAPPRSAAAAVATLEPVGGSGVRGTVRLTALAGGTRVRATATGLGSAGRYALQILDGTDCEADPAVHLGASAGGRHGGPFRPQRHAGDLGTVRNDRGQGRYDRIDPVLALRGPLSAVGRAVVLRAGPDDLTTDPDGAAGPVVACGVLRP